MKNAEPPRTPKCPWRFISAVDGSPAYAVGTARGNIYKNDNERNGETGDKEGGPVRWQRRREGGEQGDPAGVAGGSVWKNTRYSGNGAIS